MVEPIVVAIIGAIGGLTSGLVVALARPIGDNWLETQRERRGRRLDDLNQIHDALGARNYHPEGMRMTAASIGDPELAEYVGRILVASDEQQRSDAVGDAAHRIGVLRGRL